MAITATLKANVYGDEVRVKTGVVRLSFPHLLEKYDKSGKYQAQFLIPKTDAKTVEVIRSAIENAKEDGKSRLWNNVVPKKLVISMKDGDERDDPETLQEQDGCYVVTAKSKSRPPLFDTDGSDIDEEDSDALYSGCYVQAIFEAYPYTQDSKGIAFALQGVKKISDGERLGGGGYKADVSDFDDDDGFPF